MIFKKKLILTLICFLMAITTVISQDLADTTQTAGELRVKVIGLESSSGEVRIVLFNSEKSYSKDSKAFRAVELKIKDQTCEWVFKNIPYSEYAIKLFHDENGNKKLDTNLVGFPKEPYGFSNNARARFGPPEYEKVKFMFKVRAKTLEIVVK